MLEIRDLDAWYGGRQVLRSLSMAVDSGAAVGVIGRNGAGKSTLARCVMGLRTPRTSGSVVFETDMSGLSPYRRSLQGVGYVPQGRKIFRDLTTEENLTVVGRSKYPEHRWSLADLYQLFPRLAERRSVAAGRLSGGEQQMLAIGRALVLGPRLIVLDEPSEGLAPIVVDEVRDVLLQLKDAGISIVLIEQNLELVLSVVDKLCVLDSGSIVFEGSPAEVRADRTMLAELLGVALRQN